MHRQCFRSFFSFLFLFFLPPFCDNTILASSTTTATHNKQNPPKKETCALFYACNWYPSLPLLLYCPTRPNALLGHSYSFSLILSHLHHCITILSSLLPLLLISDLAVCILYVKQWGVSSCSFNETICFFSSPFVEGFDAAHAINPAGQRGRFFSFLFFFSFAWSHSVSSARPFISPRSAEVTLATDGSGSIENTSRTYNSTIIYHPQISLPAHFLLLRVIVCLAIGVTNSAIILLEKHTHTHKHPWNRPSHIAPTHTDTHTRLLPIYTDTDTRLGFWCLCVHLHPSLFFLHEQKKKQGFHLVQKWVEVRRTVHLRLLSRGWVEKGGFLFFFIKESRNVCVCKSAQALETDREITDNGLFFFVDVCV
ncbi:putative signal peptide protein [Puccinia sorghi]|uniref:Putative signal peptide protein n=1 Tax=Puccinia sorghi TaxID=27349 RepID=A0A0L6UDB8_9BASI|nr:putative signal peptide protein [Puccinia sorghi]